MSDNEDNEDYFGEGPEEEVFNPEEDQQAEEPEEDLNGLFGDEEEDQQAPQQEQQQKSEAENRRQTLQALANKAKQTAEGGKKRKKKDKESSDTPKRLKKTPTEERGRRKPASKEDNDDEEGLLGDGEDDDEPVENDEDRQFIDDEGAPPEDEFGGEEEGDELAAGNYEEAEEVPEGEEEKAFGKKKRNKSEISEDERKARVFDITSLIAQMENAAQKDRTKCAMRQPAVHKMAMLKDADNKLSNRGWHDDFIECSISTALVQWLEPYVDGNGKITMPHVKIREAVLRWLDMLPFDTGLPHHRSQLQTTEIGKYVMFLSKYESETPANRRLAAKIVERWVRPIMQREPEADVSESQRRTEEMLERQRAERELKQEMQKKLKESDGRRIHANIPMPSKLDYVVAPEPKIKPDDAGPSGQRAKEKNSFIEKRIRDITRKTRHAEGKNKGGF